MREIQHAYASKAVSYHVFLSCYALQTTVVSPVCSHREQDREHTKRRQTTLSTVPFDFL
ncbi:hypothetical protein PATSB16_12940 [Pandoraea thiooxydans]|nr:hypothetical protein PATSB16_12940 [Pandoraea thiooxydans]